MWNTTLGKVLFIFTLTLFTTANWQFAQCEETDDDMLDQLAVSSEIEESVTNEKNFRSPDEGMQIPLNDDIGDKLESVDRNPIEDTDSLIPVKQDRGGQMLYEGQTASAMPDVNQSDEILNTETPSAERKSEAAMVNELHQKLVSQVIANQQQVILDQQPTTTEASQNIPLKLQDRQNNAVTQGQLFAQNQDDGEFYFLTPIRPKLAAELQETHRQHQHRLQAQRFQASQAQAQVQAQQILQAQIQLQNLQAQAAAATLKSINQDQQFFDLGPIRQELGLQYINQPYFLQSQPITEEEQTQPQLEPTLNINPFLQEFVPLQPQRQIRIQQAVLRPQSFTKTVKNQDSILKPIDRNVEMTKLVTEVGLQYTPVEETAQYTIYKVKEPEPKLQVPKSRPLTPIPKSAQPHFRSLQSRPIKILPAQQTGYTYNSKPVLLKNVQKPQQVIYKSTIDPEYYNSVKSNLLASFLRSRLPSQERGGYGATRKPIQLVSPPISVKPSYGLPAGPFRHFEPQGFIGRHPPTRDGFERKPFRPSPVDLGPFYTEPLFEPDGHNSPVPQPTTSHEQTIHPSHFTSKYVDIAYSPGIALPPNEAAFAAIQARNIGGPAFIDPGYLTSALGYELNGKVLEPFPTNNNNENDDEALAYGNSIRHSQEAQEASIQYERTLHENLQKPNLRQERNFEGPLTGRNTTRFPPSSQQQSRTGIENVELNEFNDSKESIVSTQFLAQILKATTGDDLELENY